MILVFLLFSEKIIHVTKSVHDTILILQGYEKSLDLLYREAGLKLQKVADKTEATLSDSRATGNEVFSDLNRCNAVSLHFTCTYR